MPMLTSGACWVEPVWLLGLITLVGPPGWCNVDGGPDDAVVALGIIPVSGCSPRAPVAGGSARASGSSMAAVVMLMLAYAL